MLTFDRTSSCLDGLGRVARYFQSLDVALAIGQDKTSITCLQGWLENLHISVRSIVVGHHLYIVVQTVAVPQDSAHALCNRSMHGISALTTQQCLVPLLPHRECAAILCCC